MKADYIKYLQDKAQAIREEYAMLWYQAQMGPVSTTLARRTLALLWDRSHLDILEQMSDGSDYFPTVQCYPQRLERVNSLWWLDHATAGVNGWATLRWFSSKKHAHTRKCKDAVVAEAWAARNKDSVVGKDHTVQWTGLAGASTHFVVFADGTPFYIIPITSGAWGEPKRNADAIHVEMVNALVCHLKGTEWHYWAGKIPDDVLAVQKPEALSTPFRGATYMLPYTWNQVLTNITLKRLCIAATTDWTHAAGRARMHPDRMSQHTDWRASKFDMGPLWPFDLCNQAAFEPYPIASYSFMQPCVQCPTADALGDLEELVARRQQSQSYEPTPEDDAACTLTARSIQQLLVTLYGPLALPHWGVDGLLGKETTDAIRHFQRNWNRYAPKDRLKVDGIPGIETQMRLKRALESEDFRRIPF